MNPAPRRWQYRKEMATQHSASAGIRLGALNQLDQWRILITSSTAGLDWPELALPSFSMEDPRASCGNLSSASSMKG
jgi:hypothetical protein